MPMTRVALRKGKADAYKRAILAGLYQAMRDTVNVPEGDKFMSITEHDADGFDFGHDYLGIDRTDDLVQVQIFLASGRTVDQKKHLYSRIVELLSKDPGVRPQDVCVSLVEQPPENWSFGNGQAQFVHDSERAVR